jgi:hypothetical protein
MKKLTFNGVAGARPKSAMARPSNCETLLRITTSLIRGFDTVALP